MDYLESLVTVNHTTPFCHMFRHFQVASPLFLGSPIGSHPLIVRWLRGLKAKNPPKKLVVSPWDLAVVLSALREPLYEPLDKADLSGSHLKLFSWWLCFQLGASQKYKLCALHLRLLQSIPDLCSCASTQLLWERRQMSTLCVGLWNSPNFRGRSQVT